MRICFDAHRDDGQVWCVSVGRKWLNAKRIVINVPVVSVYKGKDARQPKAYFEPTIPADVMVSAGALYVLPR